jgi:hypothetical protein
VEREGGGAIVVGLSMALVGAVRVPALRIGALCGVLRPSAGAA